MIKLLKRSEANTPIKFYISTDDGEDYFLLVCSTYCDAFRTKKAILGREAALAATDGKWTPDAQIQATCKLCAATITGWSLPAEYGDYTPENAEKLLLEYPQIQAAVDNFTSEVANFIEKK